MKMLLSTLIQNEKHLYKLNLLTSDSVWEISVKWLSKVV